MRKLSIGPDGGGPGIFWINLRDTGDLPWFRMPTLTYHETVPGHHLQVALARSQAERPMLWRFHINSAYSEGWALYAEALAAKNLIYVNFTTGFCKPGPFPCRCYGSRSKPG